MTTAHVQSGLQVAREAGDLAAAATEAVLLSGDINKLGPKEKVNYYLRVCDSLGLNPLTQPFEFITLSGKMRFYATKACTEQLRRVNGVTLTILAREVVEGCYVVTAKARDKWGREDESLGAVPIETLKGEARSNAMMKAETKAKRRVTLSICGLGLLDESEADSIPGAIRVPAAAIEAARAEGPTAQALNEIAGKLVAEIHGNHATDSKVEPTTDLGDAAERHGPVAPGSVSETTRTPSGQGVNPGAGGKAATSPKGEAPQNPQAPVDGQPGTGSADAPAAADTGEAATDAERALLGAQVAKLKWAKPKARSWLKATFGETETKALTKQQAASALALLLAAGQGDNDDAYTAVYDRLKAEGKVL